jgi:hypothetical protein
MYRAMLREAGGDTELAVRDLEDILTLFPDRRHVRDRIEALQGGDRPSVLAVDVWGGMLARDDERLAKCPRGHDEHGGDHGEHEHEGH